MKNDSVKKMTGTAILLAIEIVFQVIGNYITFPGGVSINLSLIPVALGAILFGPLSGGFLGLMNGVLVLFAPSTQVLFFQYAPLGTVVTCLTKCTIAGLVAGLVFKLINKKNFIVAAIVASLIVPVLNTGIFALCALTIIAKAIANMNEGNINTLRFVFLIVITWNFLLEFVVTTVLSPTIAKVTKIISKGQI